MATVNRRCPPRWATPNGKSQVMNRLAMDDLLVQDALELVQQRLALLAVELAGLAAEEVVHLGQRAVGERAVLRDEQLDRR